MYKNVVKIFTNYLRIFYNFVY